MALSLYKVTVGNDSWHYTSGEFDLDTGLATYVAKPLKRTDLSFGLDQTEVTLTVPADLEPFHLFKYVTPLLPFTVEIIGYPSLVTMFKGNVLSASFDGATNVASVKLGSTRALEGTTCPARSFGVTCSYELYSPECGLNALNYKSTIYTADSTIDGSTIENVAIGANGDYYYNGGYIVSSTGESQYIVSQVGNIITLLGGLVTIADVTWIEIFPGCNKSHVTCLDKFNNQEMFGGFPYIPYINIFTEGF